MREIAQNSSKAIPALEGKHYDIGLFGMWFGENYGSVLTYFALRKELMDMGYSVLMLEKPLLGERIDGEFDSTIHSRVFAREEGYEISPALHPADHVSLNRYCDTFIVGSDQVWNYKIARYFRFLSFLPFVADGHKRISYASSYGHNSSLTPMESLSRIARYINDFDAISVRETNGVAITRDEFGVTATQVVDPVFLHDRRTYERVMRAPDSGTLPDRYLLCYVLDPNAEIGRVIKDVAKRRRLRLVIMLDGRGDLEESKRRLGADEAFRCTDARQWLYYISHASFMITDSFHGACFSLLFHVQVAILANGRGTARINSLVGTYGIPFIFAHSVKELQSVLDSKREIDFEAFDAILEIEKARSKKWLKNALELKPRDRSTVNCVTHKECCGCGACYSICPVSAIAMEPDEEGFLYPSIDIEACTHCGACKKACPSLNPQFEKNANPLCFAAYTDDEVRKRSSSGGLFSLIARQLLEQGGRICGAAFDDNFVLSQSWAASEEELAPLRMSKYMQSFTGDSYKEAKDYLAQGLPVLYVGCPCQIAGLNSFLHKNYDNLITVDLLCHSGPSQYVFQRYLTEVHGGKDIAYVGFRDKDYFGWSTEMTVRYTDGQTYRETRSKDLYYRAFLPCLSARPHCQICNFSRLPRQGDLTLGDFWGVSKLNKSFTDGQGTSIVSVNTQRGLAMLQSLWGNLSLLETVPRDYVLTHGQPYGRPFRNNPLRTRFFRILKDASLATAVECSADNIFDVCLLDVQGESFGAILRAYALQTTLSESGYSVLVAKRPIEHVRLSRISPYRLDEFGLEYFPAISARRSEREQNDFKHYCRGFAIEAAHLDYSLSEITGGKGAVEYCAIRNAAFLNPILFLDRRKLEAIIGDACCIKGGTIAVSSAFQLKQNDEFQLDSFDGSIVDLTQDMSLREWLSTISQADLVIADDYDTACTAVALGTPIALWENTDFEMRNQLAVCGIDAPVVQCLQDIDQMLGNGPSLVVNQESLQNKIVSARTEFVAAVETMMGDPVPRKKNEPAAKSSSSGDTSKGKRSLFSKGIRSLKRNGVSKTVKKVATYLKRRNKSQHGS